MMHRILVFIVLLVGLIGATMVLWYKNSMMHSYTNVESKQFIISLGDSTYEILSRLHEQSLINEYYPALYYVYNKRAVFVPGEFIVPERYTIPELVELLSHESKTDWTLTIPEGWSKEQIADALLKYKLSPEAFLELAKDSEGTLFPDTYSIDKKTTVASLIERMKSQYEKKISGLPITRNELILASIVEREAKNDDDRALIAAIYKNRLNINMLLEADPTVQYAKYTDLGQAPVKDGKKNYWASITRDDYKGVKSPYNTYLKAGLPPGPICNPGLKSLQAVINPAKTDALFFFHKSDGVIVTSRTLEEHNRNKAKYLR